jgi:hypothetical protein
MKQPQRKLNRYNASLAPKPGACSKHPIMKPKIQGKKTRVALMEYEWSDLRAIITARELRLRARMSVAQIAATMKATEDEVRYWLRQPGETRNHVSDTLTVQVKIVRGGKPRLDEAHMEFWRHESIRAWARKNLPPLFRTFGPDGKPISAPQR